MLGSLLYFKQEKKKRTKSKKNPSTKPNTTKSTTNATKLNQTMNATSRSSSTNDPRHRSRSFDTFDATGHKRSLSNKDLTTAMTALNRSYGSSNGSTDSSRTTFVKSMKRARSTSSRNISNAYSSNLLPPRNISADGTSRARRALLTKLNSTAPSFSKSFAATLTSNNLQMNQNTPTTIHGAFEQSAQLHPKRTAIVCSDGRRLSFLVLNRMANRLARYLMTLGVPWRSASISKEDKNSSINNPPLQCVGVCATGHWSIIAMLGIMKTGNAYVPLDPNYPASRVAFMAQDSCLSLVITENILKSNASVSQLNTLIVGGTKEKLITLLSIDEKWTSICSKCSAEPLSSNEISQQINNPEKNSTEKTTENAKNKTNTDNTNHRDVAYVLYTSGSTGKPKGVCGTHAAMLNRFEWMWNEYPFHSTELVCSKTSLNFVDSIFEIFGALGCGIPILIVPNDIRSDPEELIRLLARAHVTRLIAVPSLLRAMLQIRPDLGSVLPHLKTWTISGEALPLDLVNLFFENAPEGSRLLNLYGSTEVAADVTCMEITLNDVMSGRLKEMGPIVPIGYPISNTDVLIVDPGK